MNKEGFTRSATIDFKKLLSNVVSLSIIQGMNLLLPLLTFPYLLRVLGVECFGVLSIISSFFNYSFVILEYSFNLTATKDVSLKGLDKEYLSHLVSNIFFFKLLALLVILVFSAIFYLLVPVFFENSGVYFFSLGFVFFNSLFPNWLFLGLQSLKVSVFIQSFSRLSATLFIFYLVHGPEDAYIVPLLNMIFSIVSFSCFLFYFFIFLDLKILKPNVLEMICFLRDGWFVFLSQIKMVLFSSTNVLIIGFFYGPIFAGYFSAAEKIMRAFALIQTPLTSSLYPIMSRKISENISEAKVFVLRILFFGGVIYFSVLVFIYFNVDSVVFLVSGKYISEVSFALRIMIFCPFLIFLNNIFGTQILLNLGKDKVFFYVLLICSFFSLVSCSLLSYFYSYVGTAFSLLLTEILIASLFFYLAMKFFFKREV